MPDVLRFPVVPSKCEPGALVRLRDRFCSVLGEPNFVLEALSTARQEPPPQDNVLVLDTSSFICSGVPLNLRKRL